MDLSQENPRADCRLDVNAVANNLDCSPRHVHRMADAGHIPRPSHIGRLIRWQQSKILQWKDEGCPISSDPVGGLSARGEHTPKNLSHQALI